MISTAGMDFGLNMLRYAPTNESVVLSPVSVIFALTMLQIGARGTTKSQISSAISGGPPNQTTEDYYATLYGQLQNASEGVETNIANGFFLNKKYAIKKDYEDKIKKKFGAKVQALDFNKAYGAVEAINGFVDKNTNGKIHDMVTTNSIKGAHSLLVNAIYFAAEWRYKFFKGSTNKRMFYRSERDGREIEFMNVFREYRLYVEDAELQVISLQYVDRSYALNIFLPKTRFGLSEIQWKLTGDRIEKLLSELDQAYVSVTIPKMKIETTFELKESLSSLGISDIFGFNADLSGIADPPPPLISQATHKAIIEVDEDGTTAAAATLFKAQWKSLRVTVPIEFRADHPFLFILTKDKNPLFMGQFM